MNCYRCNTKENLSIKVRRKNGNYTMICKSCRNKAYIRSKGLSVFKASRAEKITEEDWRIASKKNVQRILTGNYKVIYIND